MKKAKKPKPLHPGTMRRMRKEKRCFEPSHPESIERYAKDSVKLHEEIGRLEARVSELLKNTIDKDLAEEEKKSEFFKGLHEGKEEVAQALKKDQACFNSFHNFTNDKKPMNLDLTEILALLVHIKKSYMIGNSNIKVTVLCPMDFHPGKQDRRLMRDAIRNATVEITKDI